MSHNILSLQAQRFDVRATLGQCMLNINGETIDCEIDKDPAYATSPTYKVRRKEGGEVLCTFRPYHLHGGPIHYQIEGVSQTGGDGALIVPANGLLDRDDDEDDPDYLGAD